MTDHWSAGWPASLHDAHFSHGLVHHHHLRPLYVIGLGEEVQEMLNINRIVSGRDAKCDGAANTIAVLNK